VTAEIELTGIDGTNPLGFLAALGVLSLPGADGVARGRLSWTDDAVPRAVVSGFSSVEEIVDLAVAERDYWRGCVAVSFSIDGVMIDDVKLAPEDLRSYLEACLSADDGGRSIALASSLVVEGGVDNQGLAKPTDLHFTAGTQKFLRMVRELLDATDGADSLNALVGPWAFDSPLPSLMWNTSDDRVYALSARDPSKDKKLTVPGAELLALFGLSAIPIFSAGERTRTSACSGTWKQGAFTWPLWSRGSCSRAVRSLLAHADADQESRLVAWSVVRMMQCRIRRSEQGGYGSFSPSTEIWNA